VPLWSGRRFGFAIVHLLSGIKIASAADIVVGRKCLVFFEFDTEDVVEVVYAYPRALLLYDYCLAVVCVVVPFSFAVGDRFTALEGDLYSVSALHFLTSFRVQLTAQMGIRKPP